MTPHLRKGLMLALGLGAGLGLMAGSVLVALAENSRPSDAEIRQRATELGMVDLATYQAPASGNPAPAPEPPPPQVQKTVTFVVARGMGFTEIGQMLQKAGVPINADALSARAAERKLAGSAQPGAYQFTLNDQVTLDTIIDLVTAKSS